MIESDVHCLVLGFERCTWWLATRHGHGTWGEIDRIWLRVKVERFLPEIGLSFLFPSLWCLFHFRWFHYSMQWPRKESETKQQHQQKKKKKGNLATWKPLRTGDGDSPHAASSPSQLGIFSRWFAIAEGLQLVKTCFDRISSGYIRTVIAGNAGATCPNYPMVPGRLGERRRGALNGLN